MPPRKQKKMSRILQQLVVPAISDEEDGSASQQPSPIPRVETPSSAVVGASLLLLSDASPSIVAPRTEDLPGPPQSTDSPLPTPQASSQPASQPASFPPSGKARGEGRSRPPPWTSTPVQGGASSPRLRCHPKVFWNSKLRWRAESRSHSRPQPATKRTCLCPRLRRCSWTGSATTCCCTTSGTLTTRTGP